MSLQEQTLFGLEDKVKIAIDRLQAFCPPEGYYLAFSGGKDSQCIYHLAKMAGVKFDAHYRVTSVDPPELVKFIKTNYPDVDFNIPRDKDGKVITMWSLIAKKGILPSRLIRFCCSDLKETGGKHRITVTGVRWAESAKRKNIHGIVSTNITQDVGTGKFNDNGELIMNDDNDNNRRIVEQCYRTSRVIVNPIVDWSDDEVWEFLNEVAKVPHCSLYDEGFKRLGCIGCPMAQLPQRQKELTRWAGYKRAYIKAVERGLKVRGFSHFTMGRDVLMQSRLSMTG